MQSLTKEYLLLFNAITDAETLLARLRADLIAAQQQAEKQLLEADLPPIRLEQTEQTDEE